MTLNDATGTSTTEEVDFTAGEAAIYELLLQLSEQLDELTEKVHNLSLNDNEGYSVDS